MSLASSLALVIAGLSSSAAVPTVAYAVVEYRRQGCQRRTEQFFAFGARVESDQIFVRVRQLLEAESTGTEGAAQELKGVDKQEKYHFMGTYEELAVLGNSGLVRLEIAYYMHGYAVILCKRSSAFHTGLDPPVPDDPHWHVFADFAERMEECQERLTRLTPAQRSERRRMRF